ENRVLEVERLKQALKNLSFSSAADPLQQSDEFIRKDAGLYDCLRFDLYMPGCIEAVEHLRMQHLRMQHLRMHHLCMPGCITRLSVFIPAGLDESLEKLVLEDALKSAVRRLAMAKAALVALLRSLSLPTFCTSLITLENPWFLYHGVR